MLPGLSNATSDVFQANPPRPLSSSAQHGSLHSHGDLPDGGSDPAHRSASPRTVNGLDRATGVNASVLDSRLRGLNGDDQQLDARYELGAALAGQRIIDYERALTPNAHRQPPGFKVVKKSGSSTDGVQLQDFPNGMLNTFGKSMDAGLLTPWNRDLDAYLIPLASRFALCCSSGLETVLCSRYAASRLAYGLYAFLSRT